MINKLVVYIAVLFGSIFSIPAAMGDRLLVYVENGQAHEISREVQPLASVFLIVRGPTGQISYFFFYP